MDNAPGLIDSYDVVVRVNNYKLFPETGFRTDVHYSFYGRSIRKTADELKADGVYLCMCKCPDEKFMESDWHRRRRKTNGTDFRYIYQDRSAFWFCPVWVSDNFKQCFAMLGNHVPTTGFSALQDILTLGPKVIYMTGFDFFESKVHNVNERWREQNKLDPICHVPRSEFKWLRTHIDQIPVKMDKRLKQMVRKDDIRIQRQSIS